MTMIALTRIFLLTHGQPSLTREVTTPHLASFITVCLSLITTKPPGQTGGIKDQSDAYFETALQCLIRLLPNHPAAFRPFNNQIRLLISPLVAPTPSDLKTSNDTRNIALSQRSSTLARHFHALLPFCAAKNGASEEWRKYVSTILKQIGQTADRAFRAVHESDANDLGEASEEPASQIDDDLMLIGWHGVGAGCERIRGLLLLLSAYLTTKGNMSYQVPIKAIYEMAERLLSVTSPQSPVLGTRTEGVNRQFTREERESLYMMLPHVHTAALEVLSTMISRMSLLSFGIAEDLLEQIGWMVQRSSPTTELRSIVYKVMDQIAGMIGTSITAQKSTSISIIIRMACKDLIPEAKESRVLNSNRNGNISKPDYNADSFTSNAAYSLRKAKTLQTYQKNALLFLSTALLRLPAPTLSSVRPEIDRVAILLQHEKLQLTSILNRQIGSRHQNANLIPFLAKSHDPLVEALIHRRLGAVVGQENDPDDDGIESEMNDLPVEPEVVVPSFNSDLASSFRDVSPPKMHKVHKPEDVEFVNSKRTAESIDLANEVTQIDEIDHINKKARLHQETENQTPYAEAVKNTTMSNVDSKPAETEAQPNTIAIEIDMLDSGEANSDSDDSFEIPEIVVDLDDEDSEEEGQG